MHKLYETIIKLNNRQGQKQQFELLKREKEEQQNQTKNGQQTEVAGILKEQFFAEDQHIFKKEKIQNELRKEKYALNGKI